jgi:hypothetical protein
VPHLLTDQSSICSRLYTFLSSKLGPWWQMPLICIGLAVKDLCKIMIAVFDLVEVCVYSLYIPF